MTHLSLTGVAAFLTPELTQFCRDAPHEFTEQQRSVFCVFSGNGVANLRDHLNHMMNISAARYANRRLGGNASDSDYGDDVTENGDGSGNEDGIAELDGGAPLPGQHTMYRHDEDDDDNTGEEGDDEEDPVPPDYRQPRRRRVSHSDAGAASMETIRRFRIDGPGQDIPGPSSLPLSSLMHYPPHPTVPAQFQFPLHPTDPASYVPSQRYLQNMQTGLHPIPTDAILEQAILQQYPHLRLPRDRQTVQHLMLSRHYDEGTGASGNNLHQPHPVPSTPSPQTLPLHTSLSRHAFLDPQQQFSNRFQDPRSPGHEIQTRPQRPTHLHQHRSSSETLSFQMQQMPLFTTPSTTPQGQPHQRSSSPWIPISNATPASSPRMMATHNEVSSQEYWSHGRPFVTTPGLFAHSSVPATPTMMGGRSMSNPQSGSSANLSMHYNPNLQNGQHFAHIHPWRPESGPSSNNINGAVVQTAQLRGGEDDIDNASDLDIDIDLGSDIDEGAPVSQPDQQNSNSHSNGGNNGRDGGRGSNMMMV